jgi:hypothetical protein
MSLRDQLLEGQRSAADYLEEVRAAFDAHETGVAREEQAVRQLLSDFTAELPREYLEQHDLIVESPHARRLMVLHTSKPEPPEEAETEQDRERHPNLKAVLERALGRDKCVTVASITFDTRSLQFFFSDFSTNFERKSPLPPNRQSYGLLAKYIGRAVSLYLLDEEDRNKVVEFEKNRREFRDTLGET